MTDSDESLSDAMAARARARVGSTLRGKWHLDALLGVGGMGTVYAATHRNGTRAAVKILHPELAANVVIRERFLREGKIANTVEHEGAVRVLDDDTSEEGLVYLVAEFLEGETLEQRRLRVGGVLPEEELVPILDAVLDVLAVAHDKGVVHRDLKPENVFVTRAGKVKLLDFGIARARALAGPTNTTPGGALGTPSFMSPEQALGRWDEVDAKSDLWALGATVFALVTGRVLHDGATTNEALLSAMTKPAPPLASVAPQVTPGFAAVIDRALAFEKPNRWPDARAMQAAVRGLGGSATPVVAPATNAAPAQEEMGLQATLAHPSAPGPTTLSNAMAMTAPTTRAVSRRLWIAGIGVALLLGIGVVIAVSHRTPPVPAPATHAAEVTSTVVAAPPPSVSEAPVAARSAEPAPTEHPAVVRPTPVIRSTNPVVTSATTKPNCTPPYVVDPATGKKTWKVECL